MKKRSCSVIIAVIGFLALAVCASAMPEPTYFCQDDFMLTFGEIGNPLAEGTALSAAGRLLKWSENKLAGWFSLEAAMSQPGQVVGDKWTVTFDEGTLTLHSTKTGGTVYWTGNLQQLTLTGYVDPSGRFAASAFPRPSYESEPTEFIAVGNASFQRTGGTWTDPALVLQWVGSYNWNYDEDTPQASSTVFGNLQAKIAVPEPGSVAALVCGLVGFVGFAGRRRS